MCVKVERVSNLVSSIFSIASIAGRSTLQTLGFGRRKTISFVLEVFIIILFRKAHNWMASNSSQSLTSVCSGTGRFVSSAYLKTILIRDTGFKSL